MKQSLFITLLERAFNLIKIDIEKLLQKKKRLLPSENKGKKLCYCRWTGAELITFTPILGRFIYCASYRQMAQHRDGIHTTSSFNHGSKSLVITVRLSSQRENERVMLGPKNTSTIKRISFSFSPTFCRFTFCRDTIYTWRVKKSEDQEKLNFPLT